jgi:hypothetical protein
MSNTLNEYRKKTEQEWKVWRENHKPGDPIPKEYIEFVEQVVVPRAEKTRIRVRQEFDKLR